jgi:outer membrane protein TolC
MQIDSIKLEQLLDLVTLEARSSWRDVITNLKNIDAAKIGLDLQKEILENEEERFNIGLSKTTDVLEAQAELIEAELVYNKSLADYNISINEHKFSLGTLLKDKKIILDD